MTRTLVAGFGNELRGDDGFGVLVIRRLEQETLPDGVQLLEVGTGGLRLAQALLTPYDHLIVVDAVARGGQPGTLYTLEVTEVDLSGGVDMHAAVPDRALAVAKALNALPRRVHLVGCEAGEVDELMADPSPQVRDAIERAAVEVRALVSEGRRR
jgi:hydrogenase maturation protease